MSEGAASGGDPLADDELLYRRVTRGQADPATGLPNSSAFRTSHDDGVSTSAASLVSIEDCLAEGHPGMGVVSVKAGDARACGFQVVRDPEDPKHVLLRPPAGRKPADRAAKQLAERATRVRPPT